MTFIRNRKFAKQAGMTLIETIVSLSILAVVVSVALSLYNSATSQQASTQMMSDLSALRSATKSVYYGQGGYGSANLNQVLVHAKKVPTTMLVTAGTPPVITHGLSGTVSVTGAVSSFTISVTKIPTDVCLNVLAGTKGWNSVQVGAATPVTTFPISPDTASAQCSTSDDNTIVFQST